jgi:hypothetical protein
MSDSDPEPKPAGRGGARCERSAAAAPAAPISEIDVLAAVQRAERHRAGRSPGVPAWQILEHLLLPRRSAAARAVRARLGALAADGLLLRSRRHGVEALAIAPAGEQRLARARARGEEVVLPESPQHRAWRNARRTAEQEIDRLRAELQDLLSAAARGLAAEPPPASDEWFELAEALHGAARRLGAASHCLREWREPGDERADVDDHREPGDERLPERRREELRALRAGRRNARLWSDREPAP